MTNAELAMRQERAVRETYVIAETQGGFRVYAPSDPKRAYLVTGSAEEPACTCPDFKLHAADPTWRCKHILAVLGQYQEGMRADESAVEERRAIQEESRAPRKKRAPAGPPSENVGLMLIKRSVSPDRRIDSLSVEFSTPTDSVPDDMIRTRADELMKLQSSIVEGFLRRHEPTPVRPARSNGQAAQPSQPAATAGSPAVPAQLREVAGMDGKWGRRLFINVEVNGKTLKIFGNREQLAATVAAAGFAGVEIEEGTDLNLPCRVTTKPSPDGKYTNVDRVLPANGQQQPRTARS